MDYILYALSAVLVFFGILGLLTNIYFKSEKFKKMKNEVSSYTHECNELNKHIESLRDTDNNYIRTDYGVANIVDNSRYNFKRKEFNKFSNSKHVYNCSLNVCRNAQNKPFEYMCKYFNIPKTEESLVKFEEMLNNFSAVDEGRRYLVEKENILLNHLQDQIPWYVKKFYMQRFVTELGFEPVDLSNLHFPTYTFQYVSAGGNSSMQAGVNMDVDNIERFIHFLNEHIKWRKSVEGQRALMTSTLRNKIKERDNYTCCNCGNSIYNEPNLLLEIDHIVPLSKGGMSNEENLQTLCWRCNRSKGSKLI